MGLSEFDNIMNNDDLWDDEEDEDFFDEDNEDNACVNCGLVGFDTCCCCGAPLCPECNETGAGFCDECPTDEWIANQVKNSHPIEELWTALDNEDIPF